MKPNKFSLVAGQINVASRVQLELLPTSVPFEYGWMLPVLVISRIDATLLNITAFGNAGQACLLFSSADLSNWIPIATNQIAGDGTAVFHEDYNPARARLFYRLAIP